MNEWIKGGLVAGIIFLFGLLIFLFDIEFSESAWIFLILVIGLIILNNKLNKIIGLLEIKSLKKK